MTTYSKHFSPKTTPQSDPIPGKSQVKNRAGGFVFQVDRWVQLERFLILGNAGGSYYAGEREMTKENAQCVLDCLEEDGDRTVHTIVKISQSGRAPKNSPAVFALALCSAIGSDQVRALAHSNIPNVCRIGTDLFRFMEDRKNLKGLSGRNFRNGVAGWYTSKQTGDLAYQVTKYQQRNGWTHRDVLRLAHPKSFRLGGVFKWITSGEVLEVLPEPIIGLEEVKAATTEHEVVRIIDQYSLVRECIPTKWLNSRAVWEALLVRMPMGAMLRNLGKMASVGLLKPMSNACATIAERLVDPERLKKARIHPISILIAKSIYSGGQGLRGSLTWAPDQMIMDALEQSFYLSFDCVEPTNKRHLLGLDVSGSMWGSFLAGSFVNCAQATAAMAMVAVRSEPLVHTTAFSGGFESVPISKSTSFVDAMRIMELLGSRMGITDCALPMLYALKKRIDVDAFVVYTDNETWIGSMHPVQALQQYRNKVNPRAKLVVVGMVANRFTIADPSDAGMLDVVGFDASVPSLISDFVKN